MVHFYEGMIVYVLVALHGDTNLTLTYDTFFDQVAGPAEQGGRGVVSPPSAKVFCELPSLVPS